MVYNMADSKGASITRVVQKKAGRAKEMLMQNLGKADKTTDELFELYHNNFLKQQTNATRLQKELKNYVTCVRAMQTATKGLMDCLTEIYEPEWPGQEQVPVKGTALEILWEDLCHKINDQVTIPLSTYLSQFSEVRAKINKRGRKLVDYDSSRHSMEAQEGSKKRDEIRLAKTREQLEESRRLYEVLNKELHDELPALYDSRISFLISTLQTLFSAETTFHGEYSRVNAQFADMVDILAQEAQKGSFHSSPRILTSSSSLPMGDHIKSLDDSVNISRHYEEINEKQGGEPGTSPISSLNIIDPANQQVMVSPPRSHSNSGEKSGEATNGFDTSSKKTHEEHVYDIPAGATTSDLPPGVLYRVRATYKYAAEDSDELSFDIGEVIRVVEYDDPEEQEEGWLMGVKETGGDRGLFPGNFTRPI